MLHIIFIKEMHIKIIRYHNIPIEMKWSEVTQLCLTLCNPTDCSLPGSFVHGIFQAIVLEWLAISFFRGSSQPRDRTWIPHIVDRRFTVWATREVQAYGRDVIRGGPDMIAIFDDGRKGSWAKEGRQLWKLGITLSWQIRS